MKTASHKRFSAIFLVLALSFILVFSSGFASATLEDDTTQYYNFDQASGNLIDQTPNGDNLTATGTITYGETGIIEDATKTTAPGSFSNVFAGNNILSGADIDSFSYSFWFKGVTEGNGFNFLSTMESGATTFGIRSYIVSGTFYSQTVTAGYGPNYAHSLTFDTDWHHVVVTLDNGNGSFYLDGDYVDSWSWDGRSLTHTDLNIMNGANAASSTGTYLMDETAVFDGKVLNSSEVSTLWNDGDGKVYPYEDEATGEINITQVSDNSSSTYPKHNESVNHTAFIQSNTTLAGYLFSWNNSGSFVNDTFQTLSGSSSWVNIIKQISLPKNSIIGWQIFANDTEGKLAYSDIATYIVKNTLPQILGDPYFNSSTVVQDGAIKVSVELNDTDGLSDIDSVIANISSQNGTSYSGENTTPINYKYYSSNPILNDSGFIQVESSTIYENGFIHRWMAETSQATGNRVLHYSNSTNGINFTNPVNLSGMPGGNGQGYALFYDIKVNDTYYKVAINASQAESSMDIEVFNSTNKINWTKACPNEITTGGYKKNPALWYNETDGSWHALFEEGSGGGFYVYYWNSTNLCSGWTKHDQQFGTRAGNADIKYRNDEFIVYYGDMTVSSGNMNISLARGTHLNDLTKVAKFLINTTAGVWTDDHVSNPDVLIIDDGNTSFFAPYMVYFSGSDIQLGVAYNKDNETFDEVHFGTQTGFVSENVTLSQEGSTNIWSGKYDDTATTGYRNLTDLWVSDSDDSVYQSYSNLSFEVIVAPDDRPDIEAIYPNNNHNQTNGTINFIADVGVSGASTISNVSLYINGSIIETNSSEELGTYNFEQTLSDGYYSWYITAVDNFTTANSTETRYFTIDTTGPTINISEPNGILGYFKVGNNETLNYTITNGDTSYCWYEYGKVNMFNDSWTVNLVPEYLTFETNYTNINNITIYDGASNNTFTNINSACLSRENFKLYQVQIFSPASTDIYCLDDLDNTYSIGSVGYVEGGDVWLNTGINNTLNCSGNSTEFEYILGENEISVFAIDELGNKGNATSTWEYLLLEESQTFESDVDETSRQNFEINVTSLSSVISVTGVLNYNGTRYTSDSSCENGRCSISTDINIPLIESGSSQVNEFFWELTIFTASQNIQDNSSSNNQTVNRVYLEICNGTYTTQVLNFTAFDEQSLDALNFNFDGDFRFYSGSGGVYRNKTFSLDNQASVQICVSPSDSELTLVAVVEYSENNIDNYTIRNYYFDNDQVSNESQDIGLGLLRVEDSTSFILKVQDRDILPFENALVFTERFYPGIGEYKVVQVAKTDANGASVGFFEAEIGDYRFIIKSSGIVQLVTSQGKVVGEESPFTLTFTTGEDLGSSWEEFEDLDNFTGDSTWNKTTNLITYIYQDTSEDFTSARFVVEKLNYSGYQNNNICDNSSTQSSGAFTCNLTGYDPGSYISRVLITRDELPILVEQTPVQLENFSTISGRLGLFLGWFVILISIFAFKFNTIAGIVLMNLSIIFVNMIGLVAFGWVFVSAIVAISIIIMVVLER